MTVAVIGCAVFAAILCTLFIAAHRAPLGWQDADGFHFGDPFVPLTGPNSGLPSHQDTSKGDADALGGIAPVFDPDRGGKLDFHNRSDAA